VQCITELPEGFLYHVSNKITQLNPAAWFTGLITVIIVMIIMIKIKAVGDSMGEKVICSYWLATLRESA